VFLKIRYEQRLQTVKKGIMRQGKEIEELKKQLVHQQTGEDAEGSPSGHSADGASSYDYLREFLEVEIQNGPNRTSSRLGRQSLQTTGFNFNSSLYGFLDGEPNITEMSDESHININIS